MCRCMGVCFVFSVLIAGCGTKADPHAKYRDVQLKTDMTIDELKAQFGEPDSYEAFWCTGPRVHYGTDQSDVTTPEHTFRIEMLDYGPFGAHSQRMGHITKHRLSMYFVNGRLYEWAKSAPLDESQ